MTIGNDVTDINLAWRDNETLNDQFSVFHIRSTQQAETFKSLEQRNVLIREQIRCSFKPMPYYYNLNILIKKQKQKQIYKLTLQNIL